MSRLMLPGEVDTRDQQISALAAEVERLKGELAAVQQESQREKNAIAMLQRNLRPFYDSLQRLFGVMDDVVGEAVAAAGNGKWEAIKARLAPRLREAIDILLVQKSMKRTQLAAALRMDYSNCNKNVIGVLLRQGLLVDNGRDLSLKEL